MRTCNDQYRKGQLLNGYDYQLQVWVKNGVILDCDHPAEMSNDGYYCCNAKKYHGEMITAVRVNLAV